MLDLEFALAYSGRLVPMKLSEPHKPACQLHLSRALALAPASATVSPAQARQLPNARSGSDRLDIGDFTKDPKVHALNDWGALLDAQAAA